MRITIDLPDIDDGGPDQAEAPDCPHCHTPSNDQMVKTVDGLVHAHCLTDWLARRPERDAWKTLAAHVAKYPAQQSEAARTALTVIQALLATQPKES